MLTGFEKWVSLVGGKFELPEACPRRWQGFNMGVAVLAEFEPPEICPRHLQSFENGDRFGG